MGVCTVVVHAENQGFPVVGALAQPSITAQVETRIPSAIATRVVELVVPQVWTLILELGKVQDGSPFRIPLALTARLEKGGAG